MYENVMVMWELIAENGQSKRVMNIVAERVSFLSSKKQNDSN